MDHVSPLDSFAPSEFVSQDLSVCGLDFLC